VKTWKLTYDEPDRYGHERVRTVNRIIDIADFKDRAGFAYLLMAANPQLSVRDTQEVLANIGEQHERPAGWISRRRWLFHGRGESGRKPNADGLDGKALRIMGDNPRLSSRQLVYLLKQHGINRSREWVRKHRADNQ